MKYSDGRPAIRSGDVLAWSHRGWNTWYDIKLQLVRIWTRSEFSHLGIAWIVADRVFVLEAVASGVRLMPLSQLLPCYWIPRSKWGDSEERAALGLIGQPYSEWQAVLAGLKQLKRAADSSWQCAEYVSYVLDFPLHWGLTPTGVVQGLLVDEGRTLQWLNP